MDLVLILALAFGTLATVVTVFAIVNARDGFEDQSGFHLCKDQSSEKAGGSMRDDSAGSPPTLATAG